VTGATLHQRLHKSDLKDNGLISLVMDDHAIETYDSSGGKKLLMRREACLKTSI
jgi:hypothetical protein